MLHVWGRTQMHTVFRWENLKERDHFENKGTDRKTLKWIVKKYEGTVCTGFIWLSRGASEGVLNKVMKLQTEQNAKNFLTI
jgi:hypothetical protein